MDVLEHPSPDLEDEEVGREWFGEAGESASGIEAPRSGSGASGTAAGGGADSNHCKTVEGLVGEAPCLGSGAPGTAAGGGSRDDSGAPGTAVVPVVPPPPEPGEMYEALVRARPARAVGAHKVCTSGALQWCISCRAACRTGGLERLPGRCAWGEVRATFAGEAARIQAPHDTVFLHGAAFCLRCGACSTSRLFKLGGAACRPSAFGAKELKRVLSGGMPSNLDRWPLAPVERGELEGPLGPPAPARRRRCRAKSTPPASS